MDLGTADSEAGGQVSLPGAGTGPLSTSISIGANGPALSALGIWPLTPQWELFVRGGVFFASVSADLKITSGADSFGGTASDSSEELFYGLGAAFRFREGWAARAEFTQYSDIGDSDISVLSVGLTWSY